LASWPVICESLQRAAFSHKQMTFADTCYVQQGGATFLMKAAGYADGTQYSCNRGV
jgi:hypothetical protein